MATSLNDEHDFGERVRHREARWFDYRTGCLDNDDHSSTRYQHCYPGVGKHTRQQWSYRDSVDPRVVNGVAALSSKQVNGGHDLYGCVVLRLHQLEHYADDTGFSQSHPSCCMDYDHDNRPGLYHSCRRWSSQQSNRGYTGGLAAVSFDPCVGSGRWPATHEFTYVSHSWQYYCVEWEHRIFISTLFKSFRYGDE
jgi:hypothetical protein